MVQTSSERAPRSWCLFKSDTRPLAVALEAVAEVVEAERLVRIALCPPPLLGLCSVRRDVVPILRLTAPPDAGDRDPEPRVVLLILRSEHGSWGIRIDREGTVVSEGVVDAPPAKDDSVPAAAIIGSLRRGGTSHAVLDAERTWRNVRETVEVWYQEKIWTKERI